MRSYALKLYWRDTMSNSIQEMCATGINEALSRNDWLGYRKWMNLLEWVLDVRWRWCCDPRYRTVGEPLKEMTPAEARGWLDYFDRHPDKRPIRAHGTGPTDWELSLRKRAALP